MSKDMNKEKSYIQNLRCFANQVQNTGVGTPPKISVPPNLLRQAIPGYEDTLCATVMDQGEKECNQYKGKEGLARLMRSQGSLKALQPGCGWVYDPSQGVNQGALGTKEAGPSFAQKYPTAQWFSSLEDAAGRLGVTNVRDGPLAPQKEGFTEEETWAKCSSPLTRDCLLLRSRLEKCSDEGSLNAALMSSSSQPYDKALRTNPAFMMYQRKTQNALDPRIIGTGETEKETALKTFIDLYRNTTAEDTELRLAARDLCLKAGEFDAYSFCSDLKDTDVVNEKNLYCFQQDFLRMGGTASGSGYPTTVSKLTENGRPMNKASIRRLFELVFSKNDASLTLDSRLARNTKPLELSRSIENKGSETVWFDFVSWGSAQIPIILKCDYITPSTGNPFITFTSKEQVAKYNVPQDSFALMSLFEYRPESTESIRFSVTTDDGFAIGFGQPAFQDFGNDRALIFADWRYQGPTTHTQGPGQKATTHTQPSAFPIAGKDSPQRNILCSQFFQGGGWAVYDVRVARNNGGFEPVDNITSPFVQNMYVTQEPLAPWMRYEICRRGSGTFGANEGLHERRWGGQSAMTLGGQSLPSFDIQTNSLALSSVQGVRCLPFTKLNDYWMTKSRFAFTAFRSITMKIRFRLPAEMAVGEIREVFHQMNLESLAKGIYCGIGLRLRKDSDTNVSFLLSFSAPSDSFRGSEANTQVIPFGSLQDDWYYVTLDYVTENELIQNVSLKAVPMNQLKPGSTELINYPKQQGLTMRLRPFRPIRPGGGNREHSGHLVLGTPITVSKPIWMGASFAGEVAWIHGFREPLTTTELVLKDIQDTWLTRWNK